MKLTNREKILLVLLSVVAFGFLYFWFVYKPESAKINRLKDEYSQKTILLQQANGSKQRIEKIKAEINTIASEMAQKRGKLSQPVRVPDIISELDSIAEKNNLGIENISFSGDASSVKGAVKSDAGTQAASNILEGSNSTAQISGIDPNNVSQASEQQLSDGSSQKEDKLASLTITFDFSGKYSDYMSFMKYYEQHKGMVITDTLEMTRMGEECSGKVSFKVYTVMPDSADFKYNVGNIQGGKTKTDTKINKYKEEQVSPETEKVVDLIKIPIADDMAEILIPELFTEMPEKLVELKYKFEDKPDFILTNNDFSVNILVNYTQETVPSEKLEAYKNSSKAVFDALHPSTVWYDDKIVSINGKDVGVLECMTPSEYTNIYALMFFTEVDGRLLICSFECTERRMEEWRPIAKKIMNSLKVTGKTSSQ
ncbi:MAG: hypothetical protein N3I35_03440 [Clostridia bacterium]|nr:hypothetical protein [Clostridia bacterium]